jgi:hypothetical protein
MRPSQPVPAILACGASPPLGQWPSQISMSLTRFPEIRSEHWPDRVTLQFPLRRIGRLRWAGLVPMLFGFALALLPASWIWSFVRQSFHGKMHGLEFVLLLFPLVFVVAGFVPFRLGLFILCGRSRLKVTRDHIKVTELAPFVWRTRKVRVADIARLEWTDATHSKNPGSDSSFPQFIGRLGALSASLKKGGSKLLLIGYPGEWMEEVGKELSGFLQFTSTSVPVERVETLPLSSGSEPAGALADLETQPAGSKIKIDGADPGRGLTFHVPPLGFASKTAGLVVFSLIWLGIVGVITFVAARPTRQLHFGEPLLFLSLFWMVGLAMLYFSLRMALRRATITSDGSQLTVIQRGVAKSKTFSWPRTDIRAIKAAETSMKINEKPVLELQVFFSSGKKGLLGGRDEQELRWLASELRKKLNVPAHLEPANKEASERASF